MSKSVEYMAQMVNELIDTIYFRPLNTGDQVASDRLHAETVRGLGVAVPEGERLRAAESF